MDRRIFLFGATSALWAQTAPSDHLNVGIIGSGSRGQFLMQRFTADAAVRLTAVCDVYEPNLEAGLSLTKGEGKAYRHYKELLSDKNVDIVIIATPCLLYTSPSPRDPKTSRMPSSA